MRVRDAVLLSRNRRELLMLPRNRTRKERTPLLDVTGLLQREERLEERLEVRFDALSGFLHPGDESPELFIRGEVRSDGEVGCDVDIVVAAYDERNRVVGVRRITLYEDEFDGFDVFEVNLLLDTESLSKVLVYPTHG